jgi:hypothetical protein
VHVAPANLSTAKPDSFAEESLHARLICVVEAATAVNAVGSPSGLLSTILVIWAVGSPRRNALDA